ncbi:MAG TPA: cyclic nucleotide-binding domain-containing protein [Hyphomicrobiaceae bacterium]|nr:cyclic nucleotide-binding domain-containing protein [Hyphomicrobiaceae bacterium]
MRGEDLEEMRGLRIFDGVSERQVEAMLAVSFLQRFPQGVELLREGDPADFLHVVIEGKVELFSTYRERETTVSVLGSGQCYIMAAVVLDRIYLKSARSLTSARVLLIPADAVRRCFAEDPAFARCLATELAEAYRMVVKELKNQKLRSGLERLANWLLAYQSETGGARRFELPFEKKVLAARLGMVPEVLSRSFSALAAYKVRVDGPHVEIADSEALAKLARPSVTIDDPST